MDNSGPGRVKKRGIGLKIATLLLIYLVLATIANVAWRLLHFPPQMQHGVLDPGLMLLSGVILLASILAAFALTLRLFEDRPLSSVGIPLSSPWLRETGIGLLVGSVPPVLFFLTAWKLGNVQVSRVPLDLHHVFTQTLPALGSILLLALHEELVFRGYVMQLISQKAGRTAAALITGVLFGLVHSANSAANPRGLLFTAIGGVLLAWLVMRNGPALDGRRLPRRLERDGLLCAGPHCLRHNDPRLLDHHHAERPALDKWWSLRL